MDAVAIESVPSAANQSVDAVAIESVPAQEAGNVSTPHVVMSAVAAAALDKVQSGRGKGQKSKNSSNKNQQRVQIGAAIVDLVQTMRSRPWLEMSATCRRHGGDMAKCRQILPRQANFGDMVFSVSAHFCVGVSRH